MLRLLRAGRATQTPAIMVETMAMTITVFIFVNRFCLEISWSRGILFSMCLYSYMYVCSVELVMRHIYLNTLCKTIPGFLLIILFDSSMSFLPLPYQAHMYVQLYPGCS